MKPSKEALAESQGNRYDRWKGNDDGASERIRTKIVVPVGRQSFSAKKGHTFFAMGSCFARNVEERLVLAGAEVLSSKIEMKNFGATTARELGVFNKYNPHSILQELEFACGERNFSEDCLLPAGGGLFYDAQLRTNSGNGTQEALMDRRLIIENFFAQAFHADVFILTLGLIEAWYDTKTGLYLNEAPKPKLLARDRDRFKFHVLTVSECREILEKIYSLLKSHGKKEQRFVLTVSPVPLGRTFTSSDVIVANTTSKCTLRVAAHEFISAYDDVDYFPSYEAVLHSHPDLTWQVDRLHVSDFMVGQIIHAFLKRYGFTPADLDEAATHKLSEEEKIILQLTRELNSYKNRAIKMESLLKRAGLTIDNGAT